MQSRIKKEFGVEVALNIPTFKEAHSTFSSTCAKPKSPFVTITNQKSERTLLKDKSSSRLMMESKNNTSFNRLSKHPRFSSSTSLSGTRPTVAARKRNTPQKMTLNSPSKPIYNSIALKPVAVEDPAFLEDEGNISDKIITVS